MNNFIAFPMRIYNNFRYKESEEKRMSDLMLTFIPFKNVCLIYRRVGAGAAGTTLKCLPGAGAAYKFCCSVTRKKRKKIMWFCNFLQFEYRYVNTLVYNKSADTIYRAKKKLYGLIFILNFDFYSALHFMKEWGSFSCHHSCRVLENFSDVNNSSQVLNSR
jgi:hypothetical protein